MYIPGKVAIVKREDWQEGPPYDSTLACDEIPPFDYPYAGLPHSCGDWVIGGPEQIRQMIHDLQNALAEIENP